ncbi:hypothetical protein FHS42_000546 [Streptomyces zagrosensis]|uniref:Uncharacterized protein n=1 Tax=Streptomyces zagrosensis TaxID=1042984 RepID=A0A7W9UW85_9ACTN|nr:hypothetical protein [Streptomyces zagrosensis]
MSGGWTWSYDPDAEHVVGGLPAEVVTEVERLAAQLTVLGRDAADVGRAPVSSTGATRPRTPARAPGPARPCTSSRPTLSGASRGPRGHNPRLASRARVTASLSPVTSTRAASWRP